MLLGGPTLEDPLPALPAMLALGRGPLAPLAPLGLLGLLSLEQRVALSAPARRLVAGAAPLRARLERAPTPWAAGRGVVSARHAAHKGMPAELAATDLVPTPINPSPLTRGPPLLPRRQPRLGIEVGHPG